ncbi:unnamed protein product [Polarella glacialis]|uniref:Uncharacterized protein n=1 Tax=Polarella glacialis TaxID=89957 RepID=A0A813J6U6_POLGL|nr:unnamed protein product [Polarella glacialis]
MEKLSAPSMIPLDLPIVQQGVRAFLDIRTERFPPKLLNFACARSALLDEFGYSSLTFSAEVALREVADSSRWKELCAIFSFWGLQLPADESGIQYSVAIEEATRSSACGHGSGRPVRQVLFELVALAEKDKGNEFFRSGNFRAALRCYSKALATLGFQFDSMAAEESGLSGTHCADHPKFKPNQVANYSLDLTLKLQTTCSNSCLKLGHTTRATILAQNTIDNIAANPESCQMGGMPMLWQKAYHHLASALMRRGQFNRALSILAHIDRTSQVPAAYGNVGKRARAASSPATATLRGTILLLKKECAPLGCYPNLRAHLLEKKAKLLAEVDEGGGWLAIQEAFATCPLLLILPMQQLRHRMRKLPDQMPNVIKMMWRCHDPRQEFAEMSVDGRNLSRIKSMIANSFNAGMQRRLERQELQRLRSLLHGRIYPDEESDEDDEEVPQQEILFMRFMSAYVALDSMKWEDAIQDLDRLIFHVTVHPSANAYYPDHINPKRSPGRNNFQDPYLGNQELSILKFPSFYLPELLYLRALADYGLGDWKSCLYSIEAYLDLIPEGLKDHSYSHALYMKKWAELKPLQLANEPAFAKTRAGVARDLQQKMKQLDRDLGNLYYEGLDDLFDPSSWVRGRFYHDLGFVPLPQEYQEVYDALLQNAARTPRVPGMEEFGTFDGFLARAAGVTQRYRMSKQEKTKEVRQFGDRDSDMLGRHSNHMALPDTEQEMYSLKQNTMFKFMNFPGCQGEDDNDDVEDPDDQEEESEEEAEEDEEDWEEDQEEDEVQEEEEETRQEIAGSTWRRNQESPAVISPDEAAQIARQQWETLVEQRCKQMRSGTSASSTACVSALVLSFARHPSILDAVLTDSALGRKAMQENCVLQPLWANGAKILVPGLSEEVWRKADVGMSLKPFHIVVQSDDVDELQQVLRCIRYQDRPRIKANTLPVCFAASEQVSGSEQASLFQDVSSGSSREACAASACSDSDLEDGRETFLNELQEIVRSAPIVHLNVSRTFVDLAETPQLTPRTCVTASAPGALESNDDCPSR